jgi:hypothetical protein
MSSSDHPRRRSDDVRRDDVKRGDVKRVDVKRVDPLTKADPALRDALDGKPDTTVRAILVLRDPEPADSAVPEALDPHDYADRRAWRVAQIEAQRGLIEERYGSVLADMRDLGLDLVGGTLTPVVVVTGDAAAVRNALSNDMVASATFEPLS